LYLVGPEITVHEFFCHTEVRFNEMRVCTEVRFYDIELLHPPFRDFKIQHGEALVRLMQRKETGPTTPSPTKTQID